MTIDHRMGKTQYIIVIVQTRKRERKKRKKERKLRQQFISTCTKYFSLVYFVPDLPVMTNSDLVIYGQI